ncbi:MAG: polysaccharide biosynthesis/export family protein [Tsuneonella sp.]
MRLLIIVSALLLVGGCAGHPGVLDQSTTPVVQNGEMPPPTGTDLLSATRPYLIGPFDKLSVQVFGVPDLSRDEVQVDAGGRLSLPLVGSLAAAGLTPEQLADKIEAGLRGSYVRNPQVTVNLVETVSQVVTVDGQVAKPGLYPVIGRMTLMRAVATAGGTSEFAKLDDVVLFRTVDGQRMAGLYNLKAIRTGVYQDPEVFANDVVVVGDSPARRMFKDILSAAPLITTPLIILFRK